MLPACGLVAEYNPFHNGHLWQLQEIKRRTGLPVLVAMSGHFSQRGEPACLDKWSRARAAVAAGADLVLELPLPCVLSSGEFFAAAGVELLAATGCLAALACGVETAALDAAALAPLSLTPAYQQALQEGLQAGLGYPAACARAYAALLPPGTPPLERPNDILALEYAKALLPYRLPLLCLPRQDGGYNTATIPAGAVYASGRALRQAWEEGRWQAVAACVPPATLALLRQQQPPQRELFWQLAAYRLRLLSPGELAALSSCSEGLEYRLQEAAGCASLPAALALLSAKRYSASRLRRLLCQVVLGQPGPLYRRPRPRYLRVLAFNSQGRQLLRAMKEAASLPLLLRTGPSQLGRLEPAAQAQWQAEVAATEVWSLLFTPPRRPGLDYLTSPSYLP